MKAWTSALMDSLQAAPLLVGDLPEASVLDRRKLGKPDAETELNFQQKLGHLYEDALLHLLEQSENYVPLSSHLQVVNSEGITLGEMDYLLRDTDAHVYFQLELAVKFYLAHQTEDGWCYPGPDPRDNWQNKLQRMRTHQLRLARQPDAMRLLEDRFEITQVSVRQLIYGRLFIPMGVSDCPLPEAMAKDGLRGRWLYCHEWDQWMAPVGDLRVIPKPLWPVRLTSELVDTLPVVTPIELLQLADERCTLFVAGESTDPIFLVPDRWPETVSG